MPRQPTPAALSPGVARVWPVRLKTPGGYALRSLVAADAGAPFIDWLGDAEILAGLNIPRIDWTVDVLRRFIGSFDGISRHLIGIFADDDPTLLIGFYVVEVNLQHRAAQITTAVGDPRYLGRNVLQDTTPTLVSHFFDKRNVEKIGARILARNRRILFHLMNSPLFAFECVLRQEVLSPKGSREDLLLFAAFKNPAPSRNRAASG